MGGIKVTSRALYGELRAALGPTMKQNGFRRAGGGRLGWTRPSPDGHLTVWFQCDKWGWDKSWGSKFTVEFVTAPEPGSLAHLGKGRSERIGYLLEGFEDLDQLRIRNNAVIERLPGTHNGSLATAVLDDGTEIVAIGESVDTAKAVYGRDIWLNYYSLDDARDRASYFSRNLLRFVSMFEAGTKSEAGNAGVRFNEMMSMVQDTKDLAEKVRLFEAYIATEADREFREGAVEWLHQLKEIIEARAAPKGSHSKA